MNKSGHIIQLDGLRFFAVLMVMIAHFLQWQWTHPVLTNFPFVHGVTLFFVLSGFLITRILLVNRDKYLEASKGMGTLVKNFYIRRFMRIFPIYYLLLFVLYAIDHPNAREYFPWLVSYTSNVYQSIHCVFIGDFNHFWSLAVEEQFYLIWPWLILFVPKKSTLQVIIITILMALSFKIVIYSAHGNWMANTYFTLTCMHALGLGALLAYLFEYHPKTTEKLSKPLLLYVAVVFYAGSLYFQNKFDLEWYKEIFDEFLFAFVATLVILRASTNGFKFIAKYILESPFVVYSGKISY